MMATTFKLSRPLHQKGLPASKASDEVAHGVGEGVWKPFALKLRENFGRWVNGDDANLFAVASDATFVTLNDDFLSHVRSRSVSAISPVVDDASLNAIFEPDEHNPEIVALDASLGWVTTHDCVNAFPLTKPMVNESEMVNCHVARDPSLVLAIPRVGA